MEWIINSYDRRTDRDGQNRFTTEADFIMAAKDLLFDVWRGFEVRNPTRWDPGQRRGRTEGASRRQTSCAVGLARRHTENPLETLPAKARKY